MKNSAESFPLGKLSDLPIRINNRICFFSSVNPLVQNSNSLWKIKAIKIGSFADCGKRNGAYQK